MSDGGEKAKVPVWLINTSMMHEVGMEDDGKFKLKYCNYNYMDDLDSSCAEQQIIIGTKYDEQ